MGQDLDRLYSPTIREHANRPRNRRKLPDANGRAFAKNPRCGDWVTVHVRVQQGVIQEAAFESFGCALCRASASLMTETVKGLSCGAVAELAEAVEALVKDGKRGCGCEGPLESLAAVHEFPVRNACALLPWRTLLDALASSPCR